MGILSGSMALRRYRVLAAPPQDFREQYEKAVRAHALVPLDPESGRAEQKSVGWCSAFDEQDLDLTFGKFYVEGHVLLSLRIDTLKPPPAEVKRLLKQRQRELEASRQEPLSASALRELKDMIVIDLRRHTPPKSRTVDMLWNLETRQVFFGSHAQAMNEAFLRLFAETFNLGIDLEGPGVWAADIAEMSDRLLLPGLLRAKPTVELLGGFVGLRPCPRAEDVEMTHDRASRKDEPTTMTPILELLEDHRYLGREFLTWLIFRSDSENGGGAFAESESCDAFRLLVGERVRLKALGEGTGEIAARGVAPAETADVRYAIAGGLTVRETDLIFERGARVWFCSVSAEGFDIRRARLPTLLSEEDTERLTERLELLRELDAALRSAFATFLQLRLTPTWQEQEMPRLRAWLKRSIELEG